ncbi:hypothetical protein BV898_11677 [Hypsibius exemplaris]|uniref:Uncharacterized protein n=1 Tax=Hypsibius exemplaris TaxID=2072580 RepID=A0A1W0WFY7_HYPEX|nr:hypothetical protein BV898_11677 [Hypsibius exemplaris]
MDDPNLEDKSTAIPSFSGESENQAPLQQQQPNFHPSDDASLSGQILRNDLVAANQPSVGTTLDNNFPEGFPTPIGMKEPVTGKARDDGRSSVALELSEETTTARLLPDLLGEERQSDIRDDLNAKLRKINTLIANAAEIQRKYETVADPASEKSMREMQDKLQAQKQSLERELLMVTRLQQMEGSGMRALQLRDFQTRKRCTGRPVSALSHRELLRNLMRVCLTLSACCAAV